RKGAILLFFLVFSHWILDWLTHRPDLQLSPFSETRVGLGLWNHKWLAVGVEMILFIIGVLLYLFVTKLKNKKGHWITWALIIFLMIIYGLNVFGPPPKDVQSVAWADMAQWLIVAWGYWADKNRVPG